MTTESPVIPARDVVLIDPDTGDEAGTVTAAVISLAPKEEPGVLSYMASAAQKEADPRYGWKIGLEAHLQVTTTDHPQPHSYFLSRLAGEPLWLQDAHFGPTGYPFFSHGFGARELTKRGINTQLESLLDEAARSLGLVSEIGTDVPLVLAAGEPDDGFPASS